jgi:hypothetical protein
MRKKLEKWQVASKVRPVSSKKREVISMGKVLTGLALVAGLVTAMPAMADNIDRNVRIHNDSGVTLYRFYSTNTGSSKWTNDVMGSSTLPSGSSMRLNFDNKFDYCEFDFRAEFQDGSVLEWRQFNVCQESDFYYTQ